MCRSPLLRDISDDVSEYAIDDGAWVFQYGSSIAKRCLSLGCARVEATQMAFDIKGDNRAQGRASDHGPTVDLMADHAVARQGVGRGQAPMLSLLISDLARNLGEGLGPELGRQGVGRGRPRSAASSIQVEGAVIPLPARSKPESKSNSDEPGEVGKLGHRSVGAGGLAPVMYVGLDGVAASDGESVEGDRELAVGALGSADVVASAPVAQREAQPGEPRSYDKYRVHDEQGVYVGDLEP